MTEEIVIRADGNRLFLEQLALHAGEAKSPRSELMVPATIHDVVMVGASTCCPTSQSDFPDCRGDRPGISVAVSERVWRRATTDESLLRELARLEFLYERAEADGCDYSSAVR